MSKVELFLLTVKNKGVSDLRKRRQIILIAGILLLLLAVVSAEARVGVDFEFFYAHPEYDLKTNSCRRKRKSCM